MRRTFPQSASELLQEGERFRATLREVKQRFVVPDYGWYPYESLTALPVLTKLTEPAYAEVVEALSSGAVADIGCADGDLGLFFASLGAKVEAIDHVESSFNQMRGIEVLRQALELPVDVHDIDLDGRFQLPSPSYSFVLFLGTLYHLKNPYYVLESLALRADWCVVSTRIAQVTPCGARIEDEPVAYLLDAREANNDSTNYWIFSAAGLLRLFHRTGWIAVAQERVGERVDSDPVRPDADERMFVLLKSLRRHPEMQVRALHGWHAPDNDAWRWTEKRFGVEVIPPANEILSEFALRFEVPDVLFQAAPQIRVSCTIDGNLSGSVTCTRPEKLEFRGRFPADPGRRPLRLDFTVDSAFSPGPGDRRDLGIIVPLVESAPGNRDRLPFRTS